MRLLLLVLLACVSGVAQAAKVHVELVTPTQNAPYTDLQGVEHRDEPLTDLAAIIVEWGSCNGQEFGTRQSAITIQTTQVGARLRTAIYPTGLSRVCARAFAVNSKGNMSSPSNVAWKDLIGKPGQPVQLGDMVIHFTEEKTNG